MPTESKKTIDPDNGSGTDYLSLDAWEDDNGGTSSNLPSIDIIAVAECRASSGGNDTMQVYISGWSTSASNYIKIMLHPDEINTGIWNTSNYTHAITKSGSFDEIGITIVEDYVRFYDIQFETIRSNTGSLNHLEWGLLSDSDNLQIVKNCIFKGVCSGTGSAHGIFIDDFDIIIKIQDCVFYDYVSGTDNGFAGIFCDNNDIVDIYNCTIKNCRFGIVEIDHPITVKNSIVFDCYDDFYQVTTVDYCASDDLDGTNAIDITAGGQGWDDQFIDKDNDDYRVKNTSANIYHASPITNDDDSNVPVDDIAGNARPIIAGLDTSVGAFELVPPSGAIIMRRRRELIQSL